MPLSHFSVIGKYLSSSLQKNRTLRIHSAEKDLHAQGQIIIFQHVKRFTYDPFVYLPRIQSRT